MNKKEAVQVASPLDFMTFKKSSQ